MRRRTRVVVSAASVAVLATAGAVVALATPHPVCATPGQLLGVVPGGAFHADGPLPERAVRAIRVIHASGGYEGVWADGGQVVIGVEGRAWSRARAAATAVGDVAGPRISYVCEPTTERALLATQRVLLRSPLWQQRMIGFSGIDVKSAEVTIALSDRAPAESEARLFEQLGPHLRITRSHDPGVEMGPATGRMPLASDGTR